MRYRFDENAIAVGDGQMKWDDPGLVGALAGLFTFSLQDPAAIVDRYTREKEADRSLGLVAAIQGEAALGAKFVHLAIAELSIWQTPPAEMSTLPRNFADARLAEFLVRALAPSFVEAVWRDQQTAGVRALFDRPVRFTEMLDFSVNPEPETIASSVLVAPAGFDVLGDSALGELFFQVFSARQDQTIQVIDFHSNRVPILRDRFWSLRRRAPAATCFVWAGEGDTVLVDPVNQLERLVRVASNPSWRFVRDRRRFVFYGCDDTSALDALMAPVSAVLDSLN